MFRIHELARATDLSFRLTTHVHVIFAGLEMDIFINQKEYTGLTDEAGVRVVLTEQGRMPFPFDEGFSVPTGFSTSVGIKKVMNPSILHNYFITLSYGKEATNKLISNSCGITEAMIH